MSENLTSEDVASVNVWPIGVASEDEASGSVALKDEVWEDDDDVPNTYEYEIVNTT